MNTHELSKGLRQRVGLALGVATFGALALLIGSSGASASTPASPVAGAPSASSSAGSDSSTAVITPLLEMFEFGNTIGLPLACSDAGSVVSIIGAETGASKALSPLTVQLDKECSALSAQGDVYLQQAITESQGLSLINPVADPIIADLANDFVTIGTQYGPQLAPFGPTVAGLGGTVAFFEGS
jgi:hypothetical protein